MRLCKPTFLGHVFLFGAWHCEVRWSKLEQLTQIYPEGSVTVLGLEHGSPQLLSNLITTLLSRQMEKRYGPQNWERHNWFILLYSEYLTWLMMIIYTIKSLSTPSNHIDFFCDWLSLVFQVSPRVYSLMAVLHTWDYYYEGKDVGLWASVRWTWVADRVNWSSL